MPQYAYDGPEWKLVTQPLSPDELAAIGAVAVVEDPPPGPGWSLGPPDLIDVSGVPHLRPAWEPWSVQGARLRAHQRRESIYRLRIARGYLTIQGGVSYTLDLTGADNKVNWLTLKDACRDAKEAGALDMVCPLPVIARDTAIPGLTFRQVWALLNAARDWYAATMGRNHLLKLGIEAATTQEAIDALPMDTGWPE